MWSVCVCVCVWSCMCIHSDCKLLGPLSTHLTGISNIQSTAVDLIHFVSFFFLLLFFVFFFSSSSLLVPLLCPGSAPSLHTSTSTSSLNTAGKHWVCEPRGLGQGQRQSPHFHKSRGRAAGHIVDSRCTESVCVFVKEGESESARRRGRTCVCVCLCEVEWASWCSSPRLSDSLH